MPNTHDQFMGMVILLAFCLALYELMDTSASPTVGVFVIALVILMALSHFSNASAASTLMTKFSTYTQALKGSNQ